MAERKRARKNTVSSTRGICPHCGRRGVKKEEIVPGSPPVGIRECQYCLKIASKIWYTREGPVKDL